MAELRLNPATRRWILTGKRTIMPHGRKAENVCPFCPGNEQMTPQPVREVSDPSGGWAVRVFPDRAPVFQIEGQLDPRAEGMFDKMNTLGAHEIVVETPRHGLTLAQLPAEQIAKVVEVFRDRILDLKRDRRFRYVSVFKEQLPPTPTLQGHGHSQVLAAPVFPYLVGLEYRACQSHFRAKERCLFCDIVQQELQQQKRVVDQNADFLALCPFASRSPYELWLIPLRHSSSFENDLAEPSRRLSLAAFLKQSLQRIENICQSLQLVVHTEPNLGAHKPSDDWWTTIQDDFHWHIEISPNVEGQRQYFGEEGLYFNPISAEEAALILRALGPGADAAPEPA